MIEIKEIMEKKAEGEDIVSDKPLQYVISLINNHKSVNNKFKILLQ